MPGWERIVIAGVVVAVAALVAKLVDLRMARKSLDPSAATRYRVLQRTLSNFVSGILIAVSQPLRLGDRVTVDAETGQVEEIGLTYTFIRLDDGARLVIPNDKLASDTIRNSTIRSREKVAEITVHVPLTQDLGALVELLRADTGADVAVTGLDGD